MATKIEWDKWEKAKWLAGRGLHRVLPYQQPAHYEDMVEDVALRLLTDGWNVKWRVVDMLREWNGRTSRESNERYTKEQLEQNFNGSYYPTPEFAAQIKERRQGKPLCPPEKKEPDYLIATTKEAFVRRWI